MIDVVWHCGTAHVIEAPGPDDGSRCAECGALLETPRDRPARADGVKGERARVIALCRRIRDEARKLHEEMAAIRRG
jgi:hypothetical protein